MKARRDRELERSWKYLATMKDPAQTIAKRVAAFQHLLDLQHGWWQSETARHPETLRGFGVRVARAAIAAMYGRGVRRGSLAAEDLAQDALVIFFEKCSKIRKHPRAWLIGVTLTSLRSTIRSEGPQVFAESLSTMPQEPAQSAGTVPGDSAKVERLHKAIQQLSENDRQLIHLVLDGNSTDEIARKLSLSNAALRKRRSRALARLRDLLCRTE